MKRYYLAYGSNLNVSRMLERCPAARVVGTAVLKDYRLLYRGSKTGAYLTIEKAEGSQVPVAVWTTTAGDERSLDRYEGFPTFYRKEELEIMMEPLNGANRKKITAYVYIMNEVGEYGLPSEYYITTCTMGYRYFDFDKRILNKALKDTKALMASA